MSPAVGRPSPGPRGAVAIRALLRDDLPQVAALYEEVARSGSRMSSPWLEAFFGRMLLDHPWYDDEIPSLVAVEGEQVVGFVGANVRRLRVDGEIRRGCWISQFTVDSRFRGRGVGRLLLGGILEQPQDITFADGATEVTRYLWQRLGGDSSHLRCVEWIRPLRPWSLAAAVWGQRRGERPSLRRAADVLDRATLAALAGGRAASRRLARRLAAAPPRYSAFEPRAPGSPTESTVLTPSALVEDLNRIQGSLRMTPAYDLPFAEWLFEQVRDQVRGDLVARRVCRDGRALGWFLYVLVPGGRSPVLHLAAADEVSAAAVLEALIADARSKGAAAVHGRMEPLIMRPVTAQGAILRYAGQATLHSREPALAGLALSRSALLTRLEGAWWMTPHVL